MARTLGQLKPGSKCDRYEIVRLIGSGGMGEVYMALHEFTKKPVALKVLKVAHAANDHLIEKMRAEAMVLCRIKHENLIEVYDAGINEQRLIWMAMELLEGESLRERLVREGAVRPTLALQWTAQAADGVQAAHDADIIHRDLKPENVFLTKSGKIRVLDFGTATFGAFQGAPKAAADRMGTVPYMSPEHLGDEPLDGRSDVFALGMILYEMLAGRHAFAAENGGFPPMDQMVAMMLAGEPEPLLHVVGPQAWALVKSAISQTREERPASMTAFAAALRAVIPHLPESISTGIQRISATSGMHARQSMSGITPAPMTGPAEPQGGVSKGSVAVMSLLAAALGAAAVLLTQSPASAPAKDAADTEAKASSATAAPSASSAASPTASTAASTADTTEPSASASAGASSVASPPPVAGPQPPSAPRPGPTFRPPPPPPPPSGGGEIF